MEETLDNKKGFYYFVFPLYQSKDRKASHINLLYNENRAGQGHYCLIKNLAKLVGKQLSKREHARYICDGCQYFYSSQKLEEHGSNDCTHISNRLSCTDVVPDILGRNTPGNI